MSGRLLVSIFFFIRLSVILISPDKILLCWREGHGGNGVEMFWATWCGNDDSSGCCWNNSFTCWEGTDNHHHPYLHTLSLSQEFVPQFIFQPWFNHTTKITCLTTVAYAHLEVPRGMSIWDLLFPVFLDGLDIEGGSWQRYAFSFPLIWLDNSIHLHREVCTG